MDPNSGQSFLSKDYPTDELPPPSYFDSITLSSPSTSTHRNLFTAQIANQLSTLTSSLQTTRAQVSLLSNIRDQRILTQLAPHIQTYLSHFSTTGLSRGSLILVPATDLRHVDERALPTDYDFRSPEEFDRIVRVTPEKGDNTERWFWKDEDMAVRLAGNLQPVRARTAEKTALKHEAVVQPGREKRGFWSRKKSGTVSEVSSLPTLGRNEKDELVVRERKNEDRVDMDVKATEIVFRTENAFGILGTERGWAIVVNLRIHLASG